MKGLRLVRSWRTTSWTKALTQEKGRRTCCKGPSFQWSSGAFASEPGPLSDSRFCSRRLGHKLEGVLCDGESNEVVASTVVNCIKIDEGKSHVPSWQLFGRSCWPALPKPVIVVSLRDRTELDGSNPLKKEWSQPILILHKFSRLAGVKNPIQI